MAISLLAQTIDQLSREKGIDPEIIVAALEDAMAVAARKYYKAAEEMRCRFDRESGNLCVFVVRKVADPVTDPVLEISPSAARPLATAPRWPSSPGTATSTPSAPAWA